MKLQKLNLKTGNQIINVSQDTKFLVIYRGRPGTKLSADMRFVHSKPNIYSRIEFRTVLEPNATIELNAYVEIQRTAFETDTYLRVSTLLLDKNAEAHVTPSLEIMTDNVKAGHAATIGQIDQQQLNYMMSRGIDRKSAERLIVDAFLSTGIK